MAGCVEAADCGGGLDVEAVGVGFFFSAVGGMAVAFAEGGCPEEEEAADLEPVP